MIRRPGLAIGASAQYADILANEGHRLTQSLASSIGLLNLHSVAILRDLLESDEVQVSPRISQLIEVYTSLAENVLDIFFIDGIDAAGLQMGRQNAVDDFPRFREVVDPGRPQQSAAVLFRQSWMLAVTENLCHIS